MKRLIAFVAAMLLTGQVYAASCSVSEFDTLVTDASGRVMQIPLFSNNTTQTVSAAAATAVTNPFGINTRFLWIHCDEIMHIQVGTSPATGLTTGDMRIPAGGFWIGLSPSQVSAATLKIALCDIDCA